MNAFQRFSDRMVARDDLIIVNDLGSRMHDQASPHGRLFEILGHKNGRRVVREIACNTVVVGGAIAALENLTGATPTWKPATLNTIHGVTATPASTPQLKLFGVGTGGANLDFGSVIDPNIKQRDVLQPVPFRYAEIISGDDASKYFMKVPNNDGTYSWYLKEFAGNPVIKSCWKNAASADEDGTEILEEIYDSSETYGIETFTEIQIDLNTSDVREYFQATGSMATARYNTFGFYTGAKNAAGTEYGDVRLYSAVSFNNRDLTVKTKSSYLYRIYSLI